MHHTFIPKKAVYDKMVASYGVNNLLFLAFFVCLVPLTWTGDVFTSTAQLRKLAASETDLVSVLNNYIAKEENRINNLKRVLNEARSRQPREEDAYEARLSQMVQHPLSAYSVISNYHKNYNPVSNEREATVNYNELVNEMSSYGIYLPDEKDLQGAVAGILRLQRVYHISTDDLVAGIIHGHQGTPLSADDCYRIGEMALQKGEYRLASQWLRHALARNTSLTLPDSRFPVSDTLTLLARAHAMIFDYDSAVNYSRRAIGLNPENENAHAYFEEHDATQREMRAEGRPTHQDVEAWWPQEAEWQVAYGRLCRGDDIPELMSSQLICRYRPTAIPYWRVKEEIYSFRPRIALLYDVIYDTEIELLKKVALEQLYRATVGDPGNVEITEQRISKVGWVWDQISGEKVARISRRVALITGLETAYSDYFASAEPFQVVNYGLAGQYEPHVDYYEDPTYLKNMPTYLQGSGDRIATFMLYLNDVISGGATVFTKAMVRVPPVKGAAAFWYNSRKTGEYDIISEHAGCPVVIGEKWVANKWVHEAGQIFKRPCGLSVADHYSIDE